MGEAVKGAEFAAFGQRNKLRKINERFCWAEVKRRRETFSFVLPDIWPLPFVLFLAYECSDFCLRSSPIVNLQRICMKSQWVSSIISLKMHIQFSNICNKCSKGNFYCSGKLWSGNTEDETKRAAGGISEVYIFLEFLLDNPTDVHPHRDFLPLWAQNKLRMRHSNI